MRGYPVRLVLVVDCGGSIKSVQMHLLVQTLPWRPFEKKPTSNLVLISGRSAKSQASLCTYELFRQSLPLTCASV